MIVDFVELKRLLPHRYPMLLIDGLREVNGTESAVGIKAVSGNESFFQGHFPSVPVMPGVLIIEAMAQTSAAIVVYSLEESERNSKIVYFMGVEDAKFRHPVRPGCILELHVRSIKNRRNVWKYEGKAIVDDKVVTEATFSAMIVDEKDA
jgi:3-hydroxyacyl-[acyl-carrier-protein] dehydratase